jgi:hypothetical protein
MKEIWKKIPGFEGHFKASNTGKIKRLAYTRVTKNGNSMRFKEKILSQSNGRGGYQLVSILNTTQRVHRMVALAFLPNLENKSQVNHKDGNVKNNNIKNLEWVTAQENAQHASNVLLSRHGSKNGRAKLTVNKVKEARKRSSQGESALKLAKEFKVDHSTMLDCVNYKSWTSVC